MVLRHVVLLGFKKEVETEDAVRRFAALRDEVPGIDDFEWGLNCSPEGLNHGLTHCFTLTFATAEARDAYLPHPAHVAFTAWLKPRLEAVTVVDYWTNAA